MLNILLVEDDDLIMRFYIDVLTENIKSIKLIPARDGEEALAIIGRRHIDGVFLDIGLPGIDGLALARQIRKIAKYEFLPIVFATAAEHNHPETYLELHYYEYISKPFVKNDFILAAKRFIGKIKAHKHIYHEKERSLVLQEKGAFVPIPVSSILYITVKAYSKTLLIVTKNHEYKRSDITLRNQLAELPGDMFALCNKSCIVNLHNIESIKKRSDKTWSICFKNAPGKICDLSWKYHTPIISMFDKKRVAN